MGNALLNGKNESFKPNHVTDYGCAGRGTFDPFSKTKGKTKDTADRHFNKWKKCIQDKS